MKNQKFMVNQNIFDKRLQSFQNNFSSQLCWNRRGLESGLECARTETPVQFTGSQSFPKGPHRWAWRSQGAHPWPAMFRRWSIADNGKISEEVVRVENWHFQVVMMKAKWGNETERRVASSVEFKNKKHSQLKKIKNSPFNRIFLDRKGNKQLGMGFLVKKSLKVTNKNKVNGTNALLTVTKIKQIQTQTNTHWSQTKSSEIKRNKWILYRYCSCRTHPQENNILTRKNFPSWWFLQWLAENYQRIPISKTNVAGVIFWEKSQNF